MDGLTYWWKRAKEAERKARLERPKSMFDQTTYLAIRDELSCENCDNIGMWEWSDEDGTEWKCDSHKTDHFYKHGPEENSNRRTISDYFKGV